MELSFKPLTQLALSSSILFVTQNNALLQPGAMQQASADVQDLQLVDEALLTQGPEPRPV